MGKVQLKKEIANLTREQLEMFVLDAYAARKEIKEYFDFYLQPDVAKLEEKFRKIVLREFQRSRRGYSRCRISVIKRAVKDFASFQPGFESELNFRIWILKTALQAEMQLYFPESLYNSFSEFIERIIDDADRNLQAEPVLSNVLKLLRSSESGTRRFRRALLHAIGQSE